MKFTLSSSDTLGGPSLLDLQEANATVSGLAMLLQNMCPGESFTVTRID